MPQLLAFWKPSSQLQTEPGIAYQELYYGEDVAGLVDLPIHEILSLLKQEFPDHEERAGVLILPGAMGPLEWTWSWQFLRVDGNDLVAEERERILNVMRKFGCGVFDVPNQTWSALAD